MRANIFSGYLGYALTTGTIIALGVLIAVADEASDSKGRCAVNAGTNAPAFQAHAFDGKTVNFPGDYKGKVVLLDFWATWCPDCREELPNVMAMYKKFHDRGFEIVGVSLDKPQQDAVLRRFLQSHDMPWPEIYDGGYWDAAVATKYGVRAIPCPLLVDGDTGKVLAMGDDAIGGNLTKALKSALAAKNKN